MEIRFTAQADADIIEAHHYGMRNFGNAQAELYERNLRRAMAIIADTPRIAPERNEFDPPVRVHHHGKHYIVYMIQEHHILVVRVLRDESDLARHLHVSD
jgi:toxin ParE1/3/4